MQITSTLRGLDKVLEKFGELKKRSHEAEVLGVTHAAMLLRDTIVDKYVGAGHPEHPEVQSGRLKASIRYLVDKGTPVSAVVGSDADYAPHVEFGHRQQPGRFVGKLGKRLVADRVKPFPFFRPAMIDVFDTGQGQRAFAKAVKEVLKI